MNQTQSMNMRALQIIEPLIMKNPLNYIAPVRSAESPMRAASANGSRSSKAKFADYGVKLAESTVLEGNVKKAEKGE
jgi:hypothetical protein